MEKSLSKLTDTFKGSLQAAVESRLRGKTPGGPWQCGKRRKYVKRFRLQETSEDYKEDMRHERKYNSDSSGHSE